MTQIAPSTPWWSRLPRFLRPPRPVFLRHPVSATRSRIGWILLVLLAVALGAFRWTTSDERIRLRAIKFLESATHGDVSVRSARFSMFDGITLRGVRIATPADEPSTVGSEDRQIFSAESVTLHPNPWKLLLLKLDVTEITALRPEFTIVQDLETGRFNWELLRSPAALGGGRAAPERPRVRLRDAEVRTAMLGADGRKNTGRIVLDVDVSPQPESKSGYLIDIRKHSDNPNRGRMTYDPLTGSISDTPIIGLGSVRSLLPKDAQVFFDRLGLEGEISSRSIRYGTRTQPARYYELEVDGIRLTLPWSMLGSGKPPSSDPAPSTHAPPLELTGIKGRITLSGLDLDVDLRGRLNDAPCEVKGRLSRIDLELEKVGFDLELGLNGLVMPEGDARRQLMNDESAPWEVRDFLEQYDPFGPMQVKGRLSRAAQGGEVEFLGEMVSRFTLARYKEFPYPVEHPAGTIRFARDGVWIDPLIGYHGPATIRISAHTENTHRWTGYEVGVEATAVPMNDDLYRLLEPAYQRLWRRFDLRGIINTRVGVTRPNGDERTGSRPFRTTVQADLRDAHLTFNQFPYPLEGVRGRLNVEPGLIGIEGLIGRGTAPVGDNEQPAIVRVDGYYFDENPRDPASHGNLELRLEASGLRLDRHLIEAMPPDARGAFEQLQPSGIVNLLGRVFMNDPSEKLNFELDADIRDAAMCYAELPYAISDMRGRIRIAPDRLTLIELEGAHGTTGIRARGQVHQTADGYDADLKIDMAKLSLDADVRKALTGDLKELWAMLEPSGVLDLRTELHRVRNGDRVRTDHVTSVDLNGASMRYREFPLALTDLRGVVRATQQRIELQGVQGRCGKGTVNLSGTVDLTNAGPNGKLGIQAAGLTFDDAIRSAMPPAIRDGWAAMGLRGGFSLDLREFAFKPGTTGRLEYSWNGNLALRDVFLKLGLDVRDVNGTIQLRSAAMNSRGLQLHGDAALERAVFGQFDLRNLRFDAEMKEASNVLELTNARAELFGGTAVGGCTIRFLPEDTQYELTFDIRDAELHRYLQATRRLADSQQAARGLIYGKFAMRGLTSRPDQRRGGGELFLREAQVWKLPLMLKIFQLLNLAPDENMFHDGWLKFFIEGNTMHLTKIDLQGGAISLIGSGELNIDSDEINVRLLAGSPHRLRVPIVTEMIEGASRDLFELHVTGSLRDPKIETQQARNIRRALETIFPPRPGGQTDR